MVSALILGCLLALPAMMECDDSLQKNLDTFIGSLPTNILADNIKESTKDFKAACQKAGDLVSALFVGAAVCTDQVDGTSLTLQDAKINSLTKEADNVFDNLQSNLDISRFSAGDKLAMQKILNEEVSRVARQAFLALPLLKLEGSNAKYGEGGLISVAEQVVDKYTVGKEGIQSIDYNDEPEDKNQLPTTMALFFAIMRKYLHDKHPGSTVSLQNYLQELVMNKVRKGTNPPECENEDNSENENGSRPPSNLANGSETNGHVSDENEEEYCDELTPDSDSVGRRTGVAFLAVCGVDFQSITADSLTCVTKSSIWKHIKHCLDTKLFQTCIADEDLADPTVETAITYPRPNLRTGSARGWGTKRRRSKSSNPERSGYGSFLSLLKKRLKIGS